jgi:hypothetical protein
MEKGNNDFLLIIFILIAVGIAWLFAPAPSASTNSGGSSGGGGGLFSYLVPGDSGGSNAGSSSSNEDTTITQSNGGSGTTTTKPTVAKVTFYHGNSDPGETNPDQEYVTIVASSANTVPVSLAGWTLSSPVSGAVYAIPNGDHLYHSGQIGDTVPVMLNPGDIAYIVSGRSPIGESFLANECSGYLSQFQDFSPGLGNDCPLPSSELTYTIDNSRTYSDACFDYLNNMRRCTIAKSGSIPYTLPPICQNLIATRMTYNGCVDAHKNDAGFYGSEWRLYLNRTSEIWRQSREEIDLVNPSGVVVDSLNY